MDQIPAKDNIPSCSTEALRALDQLFTKSPREIDSSLGGELFKKRLAHPIRGTQLFAISKALDLSDYWTVHDLICQRNELKAAADIKANRGR